MKSKRKSIFLSKEVIAICLAIALIVTVTVAFLTSSNRNTEFETKEYVILIIIFVSVFCMSCQYYFCYEESKQTDYIECEEKDSDDLENHLSGTVYKEVFYSSQNDDNNIYAALIEHFKVKFFAKISNSENSKTISLIAKDSNDGEIFKEEFSNIEHFLSFFKFKND